MQIHTEHQNEVHPTIVASGNPKATQIALGGFLKKTRLAMKGPTGCPMSIADTARRSALSLPALSKLEAGKMENPRFTTMIEVSRGYELPFEKLASFRERSSGEQGAEAH
jgi:transcriptional regulator with XRE-family HTH domain